MASTTPGLHAPIAGAIDLIHLDDQIVVLHKPAGLPVTPERTAVAGDQPPDTLTNRLWHYLTQLPAAPGGPAAAPAAETGSAEASVLGAAPTPSEMEAPGRPFIVHRLDRDVSGVIVYARTAEAHRHLSLQFEQHTVRKIYLGIVAGCPDPAAGEINLAIGPLPKPNHRTRGRIFVNAPGAKAALTRYRTMAAFPEQALLELTPTTGRRHQLRVHLAAREHPLVGDGLYAKNREDARWPEVLVAAGHRPRVALHASRLHFRHPADNREIQFSAPLPEALQKLLNHLRTADFPSGNHSIS